MKMCIYTHIDQVYIYICVCVSVYMKDEDRFRVPAVELTEGKKMQTTIFLR